MRLYLLDLGTAAGYPLPGALVRTEEGRWLLVDTGPAGELRRDEERGAPRRGALRALYGDGPAVEDFLRGDPRRALPAQLARLGLAPGDVGIVVTTHLDHDHAGAHHLFPHAEHWVQREHLTWARGSAELRVALNRDRWEPSLRWRELDGDAEVVPGVEVIATGGHVPGHQSVLLRLPHTGAVLLAGDAVTSAVEFRVDRQPGPFDLDPAASLASTRRLLTVAEREAVRLVVFGHDPVQWPALRHPPEFYD